MRLIVFFDLPVETAKDRKNYARFRKHLQMQGFLMIQESVYSKLCLNGSVVQSTLKSLEKHKPPRGLVQALAISERQFSTITNIVGEVKSEYLYTDERLVIL